MLFSLNFSLQQGRESALVTIADDLEADITDKKRVVIGNKNMP